MSYSYHVFAINNEDVIIKIPSAKFNRLLKFDNDTHIIEFKNSKVKFATFIVELENSKPLGIINSVFNYFKFDSPGKMEKAKFYEQMVAEIDSLDSSSDSIEKESNIIHASKLFLQNRVRDDYQWYPSPSLLNKLHSLIFT